MKIASIQIELNADFLYPPQNTQKYAKNCLNLLSSFKFIHYE